jgi:hypothetical protein
VDARVTTESGQQFVTPMTDKLKAEWGKECVRYAFFMILYRNNNILIQTTSLRILGG